MITGGPLAVCMRQDRRNAPYKPLIIYPAAAG